MTRVYLDTNYLFGLLRAHEAAGDEEFRAWRRRVEQEIGEDPALVTDLVVDELAYRLVLAWLRDADDAAPLTTYRRSTSAVLRKLRPKLSVLWKALDSLDLDWATGGPASRHIAQTLMDDPGLSPRDAFHAAYAIDSQCARIVSSDAAFDRVHRVSRLGP